jgi:hypothetical protein
MHNPVYFNYGVAVHGSGNVPNRPASHGCIRIPMHISEYFPTLVERGDQIYVWDGVKEPEVYGRQPPPFDFNDPDYSTTTAATTTTVAKTTTTTAAATTTRATTTAAPAPSATAPVSTAAPTTIAPVDPTASTTAVVTGSH